MTAAAPTTHAAELEVTVSSDLALAGPEYAATLKLARDLAAELDAQVAADGHGQTRTIATYAGLLGTLRRAVRDEREARRRAGQQARPAGRLAKIQEHAARAAGGRE